MENVYAGFWKRFAAAIIDYVLLAALSAMAGWVAGTTYEAAVGTVAKRTAEGIGNVVGIIVWWLYYALLESSSAQTTPGKRALGIKVVDRQGGRISFGRATGRTFAKIVSGLILMIGYVMAGLTERKQALHDMMAECLVVHRDATADQVGQAGPAVRMPAWAAVLVVLGVGVFPLAIVAAIAIPVYQDMTLRGRVAAAITVGALTTRKVDDFYLRNKAMPRDLREAGMTDPLAREVKEVSVDPRDGTVRVVMAVPSLEGKSILFVPKTGSGDRLVWACSSSDIQEKYLPAACRR